jgi:hypothetical protein
VSVASIAPSVFAKPFLFAVGVGASHYSIPSAVGVLFGALLAPALLTRFQLCVF